MDCGTESVDREDGAMTKEQEGKAPRRRDFLKLAGLGALGSAAAATATAVGAKPVEAAKPAGYRETAHVKKVYELARF
jgi:hypothetical protein